MPPPGRRAAFLCRSSSESADLTVLLFALAATRKLSLVPSGVQNLMEWLASVLRDGEKQGSFRLDASPEQEAQIMMAIVHGALLSARAAGQPRIFSSIVGPHVARLRS